jgi:hypothetical protein
MNTYIKSPFYKKKFKFTNYWEYKRIDYMNIRKEGIIKYSKKFSFNKLRAYIVYDKKKIFRNSFFGIYNILL